MPFPTGVSQPGYARPRLRVAGAACALLLTGCATHQQGDGGASADRYGLAAASTGTVWKYDVTSDRGHATLVRRVSGVRRTADGTTYSITDSAPGSTRTLPYLVRPNGSVTQPLAQALVPSAGYTLRVRSGAISLPPSAVLAAGTPRTSRLVLSETNGTRSIDVVLTAVARSVGTNRVTVPAGTFSALHVRQTMTETAGGHEIRYLTDGWYVRRVGLVKSVSSTFRETGTSTSTRVLVSVTPGSV